MTAWCRVHGLTVGWLVVVAGLVVASVAAPWSRVTLPMLETSEYANLLVSVPVLCSLPLAAVAGQVFRAPVDPLCHVAGRSLLGDRAVVVAGLCLLYATPLLLTPMADVRVAVGPLVAQSWALLGLQALVAARLTPNAAWVPPAVVGLAGLVPGLVPLPVHPLAPADHGPVVVAASVAVWLAGCAWFLLRGPAGAADQIGGSP